MFSEVIDRLYSRRSEFTEDLLRSQSALRNFIERLRMNELTSGLGIGCGKSMRSIMYFCAANMRPTVDMHVLYETAALIEAIHFASILHDDVVDNNSTRRGSDSSLQINGNKRTILAGDYLIASVVHEFFRLHADEIVRTSFLSECKATAQGALLERTLTTSSGIDEYIRMALLKTSPLFRIAAFLGAYLSSHDLLFARRFSAFGSCFGLIYQVQNDIDCYKPQDPTESEDYIEGNITFVSVVLRKFFNYDVFDAKETSDARYRTAQELINSTRFTGVSMGIMKRHYNYTLDFLERSKQGKSTSNNYEAEREHTPTVLSGDRSL
jgi:geranylgeranyl pyrophosphate synthase